MLNHPVVTRDSERDVYHLVTLRTDDAFSQFAIPMLKIRRPLGRLIFNMGIAIPGKTVFLIETAPCQPVTTDCISTPRIAVNSRFNRPSNVFESNVLTAPDMFNMAATLFEMKGVSDCVSHNAYNTKLSSLDVWLTTAGKIIVVAWLWVLVLPNSTLPLLYKLVADDESAATDTLVLPCTVFADDESAHTDTVATARCKLVADDESTAANALLGFKFNSAACLLVQTA